MSKEVSGDKDKAKTPPNNQLALMASFLEVQKQEVEVKRDELELNSKGLDVERENNQYAFEIEKRRIEMYSTIDSKQVQYNKGHIRFLLFILCIVVLGTFIGIYLGKTEDVTKVALPIITAIAGAVGGYGVGISKNSKEKDDDD